MKHCHSSKGPLCVYKKFKDMGEKFYRAYMNYMDMTRRNLHVDNPDCVKKVVNHEYWDSVEALRGNTKTSSVKYIILSVAIGVVFILSLVLFTIYYKKKSKNRESLTEEE